MSSRASIQPSNSTPQVAKPHPQHDQSHAPPAALPVRKGAIQHDPPFTIAPFEITTRCLPPSRRLQSYASSSESIRRGGSQPSTDTVQVL
mmetsp:Transcript_104319/g.144387  ORF Transcript_104319/g.144387 Transcript_104319/m.144387 type:complete len:90 (-) Transcript_104319:125-394(-)